MTAAVDLRDAAVVDAHCHGWKNEAKLAYPAKRFLDSITLTGSCLTASADGRLLTSSTEEDLERLTDATPFAIAMRRRLARRLGVEPERGELSAARHAAYAADPHGYMASLFEDARIRGLFVDDGSPIIPSREMQREAGIPVYRVARIETWIVDLRETCSSYDELEGRFCEAARSAAGEDLIAFKSIIGYIVGLDVRHWSSSEANAAFERWRTSGWAETREDAKPVRDSLLWRLLDIAKELDRPVHIHSGAGDSSIILEHSRPKDLFQLLKERTDQVIVLIHSGWPWIEEGAYMAAVFPNVYLDTSVTTPWYALASEQKLEVILGLSSAAKVMYGSDHNTPEAIWLSAVLAREALERVLGRAVEADWLGVQDALAIGRGVLGENVLRLHGVGSSVASADR
jgi:predicted TIM-barrel fold metal-dependent hydrolase